jgi:hypothetical protein
MVPSGIKNGKEQSNILAYADDIVLIGRNEIEIRQLNVDMDNAARKLGLQINQEKTKYMIVERKNTLKQNKIGHLTIKNYKFKRVENFKYLGVILNEDNINGQNFNIHIRNLNSNKQRWKATEHFLREGV